MLEIDALTKRYGDERVLSEFSLSVERGEFVTLLGPSGSGKTTTLLALAGHLDPTAGRIHVDGEDVTDDPPETRSVGVVFQEPTLFPHMTVRENLTYALGPHGYSDRHERAEKFLSLVGLAAHAEKYPDQLSGGQKRRVELARALVYEPDVLLLDEPLAGLDRPLRASLRTEIARIHEETGVTTVAVTHDQQQAMTLSDRIVVIEDGHAVATGTPRELYQSPPTPFVASFLGEVSTLPARVVDPDEGRLSWCDFEFVLGTDTRSSPEDSVSLSPDDGIALASDSADGLSPGDTLSLYLRPENVRCSLAGNPTAADVTVEGVVQEVTHTGPQSTVAVEAPDGTHLQCQTDGFPEVRPGESVSVGFDVDALVAFVDGPRRPRVALEREIPTA